MADRLEDLADVQRHLRRGLHAQQAILHCVFLGLFAGNLAVLLQITLVSGKGDHHVRVAASLELLDPGLRAVEGLLAVTSHPDKCLRGS